MQISLALVILINAELEATEFSTGSRGFYVAGEVLAEEIRYRAQAQAVLVRSRSNPASKVMATREDMIAGLAGLVASRLVPRESVSGWRGYRAAGKVQVAGQFYQASVQAVRLE
ncbi:hypothetical protein ACIBK9_49825 [Nonomuraea sp. NPDC050227]|uniref:hypothetical protein n=1 Tax=Nonomuraea sp. NPDC050227 TaxID=3364360 RepID=UPI0037B2D1E4